MFGEGEREREKGGRSMGKCDAMRVTEWLIEWGASQERRSVACHTSEFPNWEPEITRIVGSLPIIRSRYDCAAAVNRNRATSDPIVSCMTVADRPSSSIINNPSIVSIVSLPIPRIREHVGENDRLSISKSPVDWLLSRVHEMRSSVSFCSRVIV